MKQRQSPEVDRALARIASRRPRLIDLSLDRIRRALARLGDPHLKTPPVFHVAGTNGKGSTVAYIRSILEAADYRVHAFTSPHLVRFNERIVLSGEEISDEALVDCLDRCDHEIGDETLTYFEAITCAAFLAFAETPADYLVLEVGLGGRLDATNVIEQPLASVVAPIGLDHQDYLGDTIELVAAEKAGIFKSGAPVVIGPQSPEAMVVLRSSAEEIGAPVFDFGGAWDARAEHGRLIFQDENGLSDLAPPRLFGAHQYLNAGLAIAAIRAAGVEIGDAAISAGVENTQWPARLQRLKNGPLVALADQLLGEEPEVWLDGGHNPHAATVVARALVEMEERSPRRLVLIVGMQNNKDASGFLAPFSGVAATVVAVSSSKENAASAEEIAAAAEGVGISAVTASSLEEGMRRACQYGGGDAPRVLICGSLYLAGDILAEHA